MKKILATILVASPMFVSAQFEETENLLQEAFVVIDILTVLAFAIALLAFFWGLARFVFAAGDEKAIDSGKRIMKWGIIALFVMATIWGIVAFIQGELGLNPGGAGYVPIIPIGVGGW